MQKFPLTAVGFEQLQSQLYQLTNQELQSQASAIMKDFPLWMETNFDLNNLQSQHLRAMPLANLEELSFQTAMAVQGRCKVSLIKQELKPENSYDSKYIKTATRVQVLASDNSEFEVEGELTIEIGY